MPGGGEDLAPRPLAPGRCLAVLLGSSEWGKDAGYKPAPEFAHSVEGLRDYILSQDGLGVPQHLLLDLFDSPEGAETQLRTLRAFLRERFFAFT